jgi:hypothetical protein
MIRMTMVMMIQQHDAYDVVALPCRLTYHFHRILLTEIQHQMIRMTMMMMIRMTMMMMIRMTMTMMIRICQQHVSWLPMLA